MDPRPGKKENGDLEGSPSGLLCPESMHIALENQFVVFIPV